MPKKGISGLKQKNRTFHVHPWSLVYETFAHGDRQKQRDFNVSSPSSRRDKNRNKLILFLYVEEKFVTGKLLICQTNFSFLSKKSDMCLRTDFIKEYICDYKITFPSI